MAPPWRTRLRCGRDLAVRLAAFYSAAHRLTFLVADRSDEASHHFSQPLLLPSRTHCVCCRRCPTASAKQRCDLCGSHTASICAGHPSHTLCAAAAEERRLLSSGALHTACARQCTPLVRGKLRPSTPRTHHTRCRCQVTAPSRRIRLSVEPLSLGAPLGSLYCHPTAHRLTSLTVTPVTHKCGAGNSSPKTRNTAKLKV